MAMSDLTPSPLTTFVRDVRGAAAIEIALGAAMLISAAALSFDLYSRLKAASASARVAVTMADYVSRDTAPNGDDLIDLASFLHAHEIGVPSNMVIVLSAFHQPPGEDPLPAVEILWSDDTIRVGDPTTSAELAQRCAQFDNGGNASLPDAFEMLQGEVLIVAEVCVRLTREGSLTGKLVAGDIYRLFAIPARNTEQRPVAPAYTPASPIGASPAATALALRRIAVTGAPT